MLGREVIILLDLMYEMLFDIKDIFFNQWVWILCECLEIVYKIVREYIEKEMLCQKKYYDVKVVWLIFEFGEKVYVYFLVRKSGCLLKLILFWKGFFVIEKKLFDFFYIVVCIF